MINSNLKKSGGRSYLITWFHMIIDLSTERFLIAKSLKRMISERFPNDLSSQRFLARTTVTRPFAACCVESFRLFHQIHESYQSQGNTKPFSLLMCSLNLENNWEKIELEKSFSHSIFQGFPRYSTKKSGHFESSNPPTTNQSTTMYSSKKKSPTSTRTLLSSALMSALSLSTFSFLGREISPKLVGNGWTVTIHPPPWLTSNVQHKGPVQKTIWDPHQAIKFGWKKMKILSVVWTLCCAWCQKLQKPVSCKLWNNYTGPV